MSELDQQNFKRICLINGLTFFPLLALMCWPYYYAGRIFDVSASIIYPGAFLFGLPFTLTILHGIVTVSIGRIQRDYFYHWLADRRYTYGLLYHPILVSTRLRLALISLSLSGLVAGIIFNL